MAKVTGGDGYKRRLNALTGPAAVRKIGAALFVAGQQIEVDAANSITNGAVSGKNHVPSAPGSPPNADTHRLDRSIETTQPAPLHVQISANAPYAAALEFGTSKMAARPFMAPAVAKNREEVKNLVRNAILKVKGSAGG